MNQRSKQRVVTLAAYRFADDTECFAFAKHVLTCRLMHPMLASPVGAGIEYMAQAAPSRLTARNRHRERRSSLEWLPPLIGAIA
ncbi:hypothetical protein X735_32775 [Mesorhizobium sp. L2C085B000]|nr:hypothetical protein X735_32775 [Mesorhizobium sp. L2C085B000]